jgi:DNA-binding NarL/FixJ family response regulator
MKAIIASLGSHDPDPAAADLEQIDIVRKTGVVVLAQREFIRECVGIWLASCFGELAVPVVSKPTFACSATVSGTPAAILIDASRPGWNSEWIERQVATQRDQGGDAPVVLLVDPEDADRALEMVNRLGLRGYIPTSDSAEVAAAALHLIIAGGTYIPHIPHKGITLNGLASTKPSQKSLECSASLQKLTSREQAVLQLLEMGMSNKAIARQLQMSLSTVKIHVHHIICKLDVQNRTEAVITAARLKSKPIEISSSLDFSELIR